MIPVYNEVDIIGSVIDHLRTEGIQSVILDNGSTDGSFEICSKFLGNGVLAIERMATEKFEFNRIVNKLYEMALNCNPDWVLLNAADEFLESPYPGVTLGNAIELEDGKGCNLIQFNNFEFWPTRLDTHELDVRRRLRYYTWNDDLQFRAWKVAPGIRLTGTAGHYPTFPKHLQTKVPKIKYILRHYRIRSYEHGLRKVFKERLPRYLEEEQKKGLHIHYTNFQPSEKFFIIDSRNLNLYDEDGKWVVKKTFDWTWGFQGKRWANPPVGSLTVSVAGRIPYAARIWKALFLRKYREDKT